MLCVGPARQRRSHYEAIGATNTLTASVWDTIVRVLNDRRRQARAGPTLQSRIATWWHLNPRGWLCFRPSIRLSHANYQ